jgi:hypothetical protein
LWRRPRPKLGCGAKERRIYKRIIKTDNVLVHTFANNERHEVFTAVKIGVDF